MKKQIIVCTEAGPDFPEWEMLFIFSSKMETQILQNIPCLWKEKQMVKTHIPNPPPTIFFYIR
jgi:hypothetical protein